MSGCRFDPCCGHLLPIQVCLFIFQQNKIKQKNITFDHNGSIKESLWQMSVFSAIYSVDCLCFIVYYFVVILFIFVLFFSIFLLLYYSVYFCVVFPCIFVLFFYLFWWCFLCYFFIYFCVI